VVGGGYIFLTTKRTVMPDYIFVLNLIGFAMSMLWICTICNMMVDLLALTGQVLDLPSAVLGLTLLAWGNSSGDFWANQAIAKLGLGQTAITACFAGPLFNMLVGFGIALFISTVEDSIQFPLFERYDIMIAIVFLMISITVSMVLVWLNKGVIGVNHSYALIGVYLTFMLSIIIYVI
jgi:sodium/potassium/calcium exchanger 6